MAFLPGLLAAVGGLPNIVRSVGSLVGSVADNVAKGQPFGTAIASGISTGVKALLGESPNIPNKNVTMDLPVAVTNNRLPAQLSAISPSSYNMNPLIKQQYNEKLNVNPQDLPKEKPLPLVAHEGGIIPTTTIRPVYSGSYQYKRRNKKGKFVKKGKYKY